MTNNLTVSILATLEELSNKEGLERIEKSLEEYKKRVQRATSAR